MSKWVGLGWKDVVAVEVNGLEDIIVDGVVVLESDLNVMGNERVVNVGVILNGLLQLFVTFVLD